MADTIVYRMHSTAYAASDPSRSHARRRTLAQPGDSRDLHRRTHQPSSLLETLIHAGGRKLPPRSLTRIVIPGGITIETSAWLDEPASRAFGDAWVRSARSAILRVPSIAVNGLEHNFVLNPAHPFFSKIKFESSNPFALDARFIVLP